MAREITVVPHDPVWKSLYEQEEALLWRIFDGLLIDIQHFGSTSIPGMPSKPIVDILEQWRKIPIGREARDFCSTLGAGREA